MEHVEFNTGVPARELLDGVHRLSIRHEDDRMTVHTFRHGHEPGMIPRVNRFLPRQVKEVGVTGSDL